jgi:hypothetical protein
MSVEEKDIIDLVSTKDNVVTLSIADHLTWDDEQQHLAHLQDELNRYLDFINSGELVDKFPETADHRPVVCVHFVHSPTETAQQFLEKASASIEAEGVGFTHTMLPLAENT